MILNRSAGSARLASADLLGEASVAPRGSAGALTLDRLPVGRPAVVRDVIGDEPELIRLRVMGICIGQGVHTLRGGSRPIVCVGGTRIGLAAQVARAVIVEPLDDV